MSKQTNKRTERRNKEKCIFIPQRLLLRFFFLQLPVIYLFISFLSILLNVELICHKLWGKQRDAIRS